jgi:polyphenol oxidase
VHKVRRIVTSRRGGMSPPPYEAFNLGTRVGDDPAAVAANRERLAREVALEPGRIAWMHQVHGTGVTVLDAAGRPLPPAAPGTPDPGSPDPGSTGPGSTGLGRPDQGRPDQGDFRPGAPRTDALVTSAAGLALAVLVADCVPVLLADRRAGVVAAVHAGRQGAAGGIVPAALAAMAALGATPAGTEALLGPAICGACYEVPPQLQEAVERRLPGSATRTSTGTAGLDLRAGIAAQLTAAGVTGIVHDPRCTAEDGDLYSYRRDGVTGRQAALVWLA